VELSTLNKAWDMFKTEHKPPLNVSNDNYWMTY